MVAIDDLADAGSLSELRLLAADQREAFAIGQRPESQVPHQDIIHAVADE